MNKTIINQQKSRVFLMVATYYMKAEEIKDNKLAIYEYFDIIRQYLRDMIDDHKANGEWKI